MFLLILVMTSIWGFGEATFFQTLPVDTNALKGSDVTLSCTVQNVWCSNKDRYFMYWKRQLEDESFVVISNWDQVYSDVVDRERYMVTLSECTWTFRIRNLKQTDEGYYKCYVYKNINGVESEDSKVAFVNKSGRIRPPRTNTKRFRMSFLPNACHLFNSKFKR